MVEERLELEGQRRIPDVEEIGDLSKIARDQFIERDPVVFLAFLHIPQKTLEASRLDRFQLLLHGLHVGSERKPAAVIKDQMIGRIDPLQVQPFLHGSAQGAEFRLVQQGHHKKSGAGVEMMAIPGKAVTAASGMRILLQDRDAAARFGQDGLRRSTRRSRRR